MVRIIKLSLLPFLFLLNVDCIGQSMMDSIRFENRVWSLRKKAMILNELELSEAQKSSFWPLYESYESATEFVEAEYLFLLSKYIRQMHTHSAQQLNELLEQMLENDLQIARTRKKYFKKFSQAVSPVQASAFMMLDSNFRMMIRTKISDRTPSIGFASAASVPPTK